MCVEKCAKALCIAYAFDSSDKLARTQCESATVLNACTADSDSGGTAPLAEPRPSVSTHYTSFIRHGSR